MKLHEVVLEEDGAVDQTISVSESPKDRSSFKEGEKSPLYISSISGSKTSGRNRAVSRRQAKSDDPKCLEA